MKLQLLNIVRETDDEKGIEKFKSLGYKEVVEAAFPEKPLDKDKMNKDELLAIAAKEGITVSETATKAEIVELIKAARAQ